MQDVLQIALEDADVGELFEGVSTGSKITITLDVTVSEIDEERVHATVDMVHPDVSVMESEADIELDEPEDEEVEEAEDVEEEEEDYEE
tara:strand:- start:861 stop:1127 length:267 start_codon:yes stop_codon:yes gene_type:complete